MPGEKPKLTFQFRLSKRFLFLAGFSLTGIMLAFAIPYFRLSKRVDRELAAGAFQHTFTYFYAPEIVSVLDRYSDAEVLAMQRSGYAASPFKIEFTNGAVSAIVDTGTHRTMSQAELPPRLITDVSGDGHAKRVMVKYPDIPPCWFTRLFRPRTNGSSSILV